VSGQPASLAIGAGSGAFSVALRAADGSVHESPRAAPDAGHGDLAQLVSALFTRTGIDKQSATEIRIEIGPGSYTGLRVAVTFARILAGFTDARLATATSFELIAAAALRQRLLGAGGRAFVVLDARRHGHCVAEVEVRDRVRLAVEAQVLPREALQARLGHDAIVLSPDELSLPQPVRVRRVEWPGAAVLFDPALEPAACAVEDLAPLYSMGSYAE
jgi:tRNA threonylcarbamoyl adenosine modification protein YeaZ